MANLILTLPLPLPHLLQCSPSSSATITHLSLWRPPPHHRKTRSGSTIHSLTPLLAPQTPDSTIDFLVNNLGFPPSEAAALASKLSTPFKSKHRPASVAVFFRELGLDPTQIRSIVSAVPKILGSSVDNNLRPKLSVFLQLGLSHRDLVRFINNNPQIIEASLDSTILPTIHLMRSLFGPNNEPAMVAAIKRGVWMLNSATYARRNIDLLRRRGVSDQRIQRFLLRFPKTLYGKPEWIEDVVERVELELGIPSESAMFMYAVDALAAMSKTTLESKYEIFRGYGWEEADVLTLARKLPSCLRMSDAKIRRRLDYFMTELGFDPKYLASHPVLLKLSLENRIIPRHAVLTLLKDSRVMEANLSFWTVMALTDAEFLRRFVMEYKNVVPGLCDAYLGERPDSGSLEVTTAITPLEEDDA